MKDKTPEYARRRWSNQVGINRDTEARRDPQQKILLGVDKDLGAGQGQRRGEGRTFTGNDGRCRHAAQGAEMSGVGW